mmetsp:Transcript_2870/g.10160  ORF Transcript_2870/g.10160 Transcript_2870/m.10160 type:complete len:223 (+) Transcript_2870:688-1356(+)
MFVTRVDVSTPSIEMITLATRAGKLLMRAVTERWLVVKAKSGVIESNVTASALTTVMVTGDDASSGSVLWCAVTDTEPAARPDGTVIWNDAADVPAVVTATASVTSKSSLIPSENVNTVLVKARMLETSMTMDPPRTNTASAANCEAATSTWPGLLNSTSASTCWPFHSRRTTYQPASAIATGGSCTVTLAGFFEGSSTHTSSASWMAASLPRGNTEAVRSS